MDATIQLETRVQGRTTAEELIFRSSTAPDALVEVTLGNQTIVITPTQLVMAVRGVVESPALFNS